MLAGRVFDSNDTEASKRVCIVNRRFAEHYFPGQGAIGRHLGFSILHPKPDIEIIAVIDNIIYSGPREGQWRQVVVSEPQDTRLNGETFYVRTHLDSKKIIGPIRHVVNKLDSPIAAYQV